MSFLEAAYLVLKKTKRSIHYQDLMARIMDLDLVTTRYAYPYLWHMPNTRFS